MCRSYEYYNCFLYVIACTEPQAHVRADEVSEAISELIGQSGPEVGLAALSGCDRQRNLDLARSIFSSCQHRQSLCDDGNVSSGAAWKITKRSGLD